MTKTITEARAHLDRAQLTATRVRNMTKGRRRVTGDSSSATIRARCTPAERDRWMALAEAEGTDLSCVIRDGLERWERGE